MKINFDPDDPELRDDLATIVANHHWNGSIYSDCWCGQWKGGSDHNKVASHPGHVVDVLLREIADRAAVE